MRCKKIRRFPRIRDTLLGVPIIRIIVFGGLYWGPPIMEATIIPEQKLKLRRMVLGLISCCSGCRVPHE